jgi:4-hydroxythreonine-4-phosphate dehydrogenase
MTEAALPRPIAVTPGEPAGIGPDLLLALASEGLPWPIIAIADPRLLIERAERLGLRIKIRTLSNSGGIHPPCGVGELLVHCVELAHVTTPGQADARNAHALLASLDEAVDGCVDGRYSALVTGPVNKAVINDAGIAFSGHTEYLAALCGDSHPVMMLAGGGLRVALVTTHLALRAVSDSITPALLERTIRILHTALERRFDVEAPRIAVLGLNPHAGESGHLGREEIDVIIPVLERLRDEGMTLIGPLPADTAFNPAILNNADVVLAMYHDQGLPVLKHASFGHGVNITLGLPIIRTSVDHGTAYDLAGTGNADPQSLREAIALAALMAGHGQ